MTQKYRTYRKPEELRDLAQTIATHITYRHDENGTSRDTTWESTPYEYTMLERIAYAALTALNWDREVDRSHGMSHYSEGVLAMAEFQLMESSKALPYDQETCHVNTYDTIYIPLKNVIREWPVEE